MLWIGIRRVGGRTEKGVTNHYEASRVCQYSIKIGITLQGLRVPSLRPGIVSYAKLRAAHMSFKLVVDALLLDLGPPPLLFRQQALVSGLLLRLRAWLLASAMDSQRRTQPTFSFRSFSTLARGTFLNLRLAPTHSLGWTSSGGTTWYISKCSLHFCARRREIEHRS